MWFKWLALKEFKPSGGIILPDYLPENDLQLEIQNYDSESDNMERLEGDIRIQRVNLTKLLNSGNYSITSISQITEALLVIKDKTSVIIQKTLANSELVKDIPNNTIVIIFKSSDFAPGKLEKNKSYTIGLGIKYGSLTEFVPMNLSFASSNLKVLPNPLT
jgi:hypothetical protein